MAPVAVDRPNADVAADDFDEYVNGEFYKSTIIPEDQSRWGSFMILREANLERCRVICEAPESGLVAAVYNIALQQQSASQPAEVVQQMFDGITQDVCDDVSYVCKVGELQTQGVTALFRMFNMQDAKNPELRVPYFSQAGLGLPDMSYYTDRKDLHEPYKKYIAQVCRLSGAPDVDAEKVFAFESTVAKIHLTRVECRDPDLTYNKREFEYMQALLPSFFVHLDIPDEKKREIVVQNPKLMEFLPALLKITDVSTLVGHLIFRVADTYAPFSSAELIQAHFDFHGKLLNGQQKMDEPWKRALSKMEGFIGDELGKLYVAKHFPEEKKKMCMDMVDDLVEALRETLVEVSWMSPETKEHALLKHSKFGVKIGYPTQWHSIEGLWPDGVEGKSLAELRKSYSEWYWQAEQVDKFYTPPERELWSMHPQIVNAYYSPLLNEIVFPAGILQEPFFGFDKYEMNIGAIGVVIGHEQTHGFDDKGRKFNAFGELKDWWGPEDSKEYDARAKVVVEHYAAQSYFGKNVNGELTLGENVADIGGIKLALRALRKKYPDGVPDDVYKRFFESYALIWRMLIREELALKFLTIDPHSPTRFRINAALAHIDEFVHTASYAATPYPHRLNSSAGGADDAQNSGHVIQNCGDFPPPSSPYSSMVKSISPWTPRCSS
ncbi:Endothelin-converting enzyme 1 [Porphyridium purpureum]|uniref:Endothelin-converting enzyme 1 n=1 Tax=Porphyridium purpureum TaxID=35688 RepID=A0A5J4YU61_PORPP|nr:Endothelin-converting enzyme 1 [Porphyridium purpureum]|eukprot:POR1426..scf227_4